MFVSYRILLFLLLNIMFLFINEALFTNAPLGHHNRSEQ